MSIVNCIISGNENDDNFLNRTAWRNKVKTFLFMTSSVEVMEDPHFGLACENEEEN